MRKLRQALRPFKGRGAGIRIEYKNRMFITGLSPSDVDRIKSNKPLLVLILPEGRNYRIGHILETLNIMIDYSEGLIVDAGYDMHCADIKALPIGYNYFESLVQINYSL